MSVRYHTRGARQVPDYVCQSRSIQRAQPVCQQIQGGALDDAIGKLLVETVTPLTLEVALAVQKELESRDDESERLRLHEVERVRHEADWRADAGRVARVVENWRWRNLLMLNPMTGG